MPRRWSIAAFGASVLLSGSLSAEENHPPGSLDPDLRCAIWAAVVGGDLNEDERGTADALFTYFLGRFEGRTAGMIEDSMTPELVARQAEKLEAEAAFCEPRAAEFGNRLIILGEGLQAARVTEGARED